jgi:hypothetical protein
MSSGFLVTSFRFQAVISLLLELCELLLKDIHHLAGSTHQSRVSRATQLLTPGVLVKSKSSLRGEGRSHSAFGNV